MTSLYTPPEAIAARRRANGKMLTLAGAVLVGAGLFGVVAVVAFNLVWLKGIAASFGVLAGLALLIGAMCFVSGFNMIKTARGHGAL